MTPTAPGRPGALAIGRVAQPSAAIAPGGTAGTAAAPARGGTAALARRLGSRLGNEWLPRAAWTIGRTGRLGIVGGGLLLASATFLVSTHLPVAAEVEALRGDVAAARAKAQTAPPDRAAADPVRALRTLPARAEVPAILGQLFTRATQARLAVDTAKYEIDATKGSGVVRYQIAFPVTGSYPQIRTFIDTTLASMPEVALTGLSLERKSITDGSVEAQIRMTVYARSAP